MSWFCRLIVFAAVLSSLSHDVQAKLHYFRTTSESYSQLEGQMEILNRYGVHVRHVFPPNQIIVDYENGIDIYRAQKDFVIQQLVKTKSYLCRPTARLTRYYALFGSCA
jgi:hypothetical protein